MNSRRRRDCVGNGLVVLKRKVGLSLLLVLGICALAVSLDEVSASAQTPSTCSQHASHSIPRNPWHAAQRELAPKGAQAINLCRYTGEYAGVDARGELAGADLVHGEKAIGLLTREFDSLIRFSGKKPDVEICPRGAGVDVVATLVYPRHFVTVEVQLGGCAPVTNGDVVRTAANLSGQNPDGPRLQAELKRLTRAEHSPHLAG